MVKWELRKKETQDIEKDSKVHWKFESIRLSQSGTQTYTYTSEDIMPYNKIMWGEGGGSGI